MSVLVRSARHVALLTALVCGLTATGPVVRAWGDGDPASDVLVGTPVFLAPDSGATVEQKAQLVKQLARAHRDGRALRVAVIASNSDLGSIGALWRRPQLYAQFLGRELSLVYHGELLVVMPNGFGVVRDGTGVRTPLTGLAPRHRELTAATTQAIARLTGVAAVGSAPLAVVPAPSATSGLGWWSATGVGMLLIAAVWAASLRRSPLRLRRRGSLSGGITRR